jgi:hypothetical protein
MEGRGLAAADKNFSYQLRNFLNSGYLFAYFLQNGKPYLQKNGKQE